MTPANVLLVATMSSATVFLYAGAYALGDYMATDDTTAPRMVVFAFFYMIANLIMAFVERVTGWYSDVFKALGVM